LNPYKENGTSDRRTMMPFLRKKKNSISEIIFFKKLALDHHA
jgi:hypothetical protein